MNPVWNAAQAALALVQECLGDNCVDYTRVLVETSQIIADCNTLAVSIGGLRAYSGSCVGKLQLSSNLDITLIRCCDPVGDLTSQGGYVPPSPEAIEAAVACMLRDAWNIYECMLCNACDTLGAIQGVTACCDDKTGAPEIIWGQPSGGCRSAIIRIPIVFSACCQANV